MTDDPRRRRARVALVVAAVVGLQLGAFALYRAIEGGRSSEGDESFFVEELDRAAPDIALVHRDGRTTSLRDHRGRPVLLHFWATWCPPCVEELPGLIEAARDLDVVLLAVSLDDDWAAVEHFFGGAIPAEVSRPADPEGHRRYEVIVLPDTFLIDEDGRIRGRYGGARDWTTAAAKAHLRRVAQLAAERSREK